MWVHRTPWPLGAHVRGYSDRGGRLVGGWEVVEYRWWFMIPRHADDRLGGLGRQSRGSVVGRVHV